VLDAVLTDARSMNDQLSKEDRFNVDEYFQSVRDIEVRPKKADEWLGRPIPKAPFARPEGKLKTSEEIKLMYDLMVAALQTDTTRVISYRQPVEGLFSELGFKVGGHATTHCTEKSDAYRASIARDQKQIELLAYLMDRLKALQDPNGTSVFDNSIICTAAASATTTTSATRQRWSPATAEAACSKGSTCIRVPSNAAGQSLVQHPESGRR
jgi:hypothetical protein